MNQGFGNWGQVSNPIVKTAALAANVTMTTANTFYDGPSLELGAGTWLVMGAVDASNAGIGLGELGAKLWDGTTVWDTSETLVSGAGAAGTAHVRAIITFSQTTTVKISAVTQQNNSVLRTTLSANGTGAGSPSNIWALRLG